MTNFIGQSLGRYHIFEQLGEGGMTAIASPFHASIGFRCIEPLNTP